MTVRSPRRFRHFALGSSFRRTVLLVNSFYVLNGPREWLEASPWSQTEYKDLQGVGEAHPNGGAIRLEHVKDQPRFVVEDFENPGEYRDVFTSRLDDSPVEQAIYKSHFTTQGPVSRPSALTSAIR